VRDIVIVIADLYWLADQDPETELSVPPDSLPGITLAGRFGQATSLDETWLAWLASWLGRQDLASLAPASIAAALAQGPIPAPGAGPPCAWIATPVHLLAGLSSVHLERRGVLRLSAVEASQLVQDFPVTFRDSGFSLAAVAPADLLLLGPYVPGVRTFEPARVFSMPLVEAQPRGDQGAALRRVTAEIEMWLHGHAINHGRARRGEPLVSALWPWGGGRLIPGKPGARQYDDIAFADDVRARGLWHLHGGDCWPLPDTLDDVLSYAEADRAAIILEAGPMLQTHPSWTLLEALGHIDAQFVAPALQALRKKDLDSVMLIGNDRSVMVRLPDLGKWWRPRRPALAGLTA
jgi:hypothetical protein